LDDSDPHPRACPLDDLVERRLMLVFAPTMTVATLHDLTECLIETGRLSAEVRTAVIEATRRRLLQHYGRALPTGST
jgi:hypothetical protein